MTIRNLSNTSSPSILENSVDINAIESTIATHGDIVIRSVVPSTGFGFANDYHVPDLGYLNNALLDKQDIISSNTNLTVNQLIGNVKNAKFESCTLANALQIDSTGNNRFLQSSNTIHSYIAEAAFDEGGTGSTHKSLFLISVF